MKTKHFARVSARRTNRRAGEKKLTAPVTLFAAIEAKQHEALRTIAFAERRSLADVVRNALSEFLTKHPRPQATRRVAVGR